MAATTRRACVLALVMAVVSMATTMAQNSPQDFLDSHNAARWEVGVGQQVGWDKTLADYAAWYADQRRGDCELKHSDYNRFGYGENIFKGSGDWPGWTGLRAVSDWVSEKDYYDYNSNTCSPDAPFGTCGHYTQVVWRNTNWIGCARVDCDNNLGVFITCNYYPPGNWPGEWPFLAAAARSAAA